MAVVNLDPKSLPTHTKQLLESTMIPRFKTPRRTLPTFDDDVAGKSFYTDSLAFVAIAKRNSFSVGSNMSYDYFVQTNSGSVDEEPLSSSPESVVSVPSLISYRSGASLSKSCLGSVTSLASDDDHPLCSFSSTQSMSSVYSSQNYTAKSFSRSPSKSSSNSPLKQSHTVSSPPLSPLDSKYPLFASISNSFRKLTVKTPKPIQLTTFNVQKTPLVDNWDIDDSYSSEGGPYARSVRPSGHFLKLYAIENTSQQKGLIPNIFVPEQSAKFSFFDDESDDEDDDQEFVELGEMAKSKLLNHIKLQPRTDLPAQNSLKNVTYVSVETPKKNSLIGNYSETKVEPWVNFEGVATRAKKRLNLRSHGVRNGVQFTVKGYANPRWVGVCC